MAILSIQRDWGVSPSIVRITTDDSLATITTAGYLTGTAVAASIEALQNGSFEWVEGDLVAIVYDGGEGFFTRDASDNTFVAETVPGSLSETLINGRVFVGNASNVATGVAMSGDVAIVANGTTTIQADAITTAKILDDAVTTAKILNANVTVAKLATALQPSHVVKYAGKEEDGGGSATVAITVTGVAATDIVFAQLQASTNAVNIQKVTPTTNTITVLMSGDPGASTVISYQALRAIA
jgi:hypothetical protein